MLNVLPHTIRGVGLEFAAHERDLLEMEKEPELYRKHGRLAAKLGFVVMVSAPDDAVWDIYCFLVDRFQL